MKNQIEEGKTIRYTVGDTSVKSGEVVVVGDMVGVAVTDGETGEDIALNVMGVYELPKGTGAIDQGKKVYVAVDAEAGTKNIVATATGNTFAGHSWAKAAAGDSTIAVKLNV